MADQALRFILTANDRTSAVIRGVRGNLDSLSRTAGTLNSSLGGLGAALGGAFAAGTITAFFGAVAQGLDQLNDLRDATGASIPNLSALEDVAARTGTRFESMASTLVKFNKVLNDADPGSRTERVLQSIGLQAKQLRELDPAEALRRTAVALSQYADDGNKARIVQELFGKSIQEAGPFLADLARQTRLVGTVTTEQAEAAERFNQSLAALRKNSIDAARALFGDLVPALNKVLESVQKFGGFGGTLGAIVGRDDLSRLQKLAKEQTAEMQRLNDAVSANERLAAGGDERAAARLEQIRARLAVLSKQALATSDAIKGVADTLAPTDAERKREDRGFTPTLPSARAPGDEKKKKDASLTAEQIARLQVDAEEQAAKDAAEAWKYWQEQQLENTRKAADAEALMWKQIFEEIDAEQERAIEAGKAFLDKKIEEVSEFAKEAQRNIQDIVGDSFASVLEGDFERIDDMWRSLLRRMVAQALAAQVNQALFGSGKGGDLGLLGQVFGFSIGARAEGGPVQAGRPYLVGERGKELFIPSQSGTVLSSEQTRSAGGRSIVLAPTYQTHVDARSDQATVLREVQALNEANNRQLVAQLKAAGVM